MFSSASKGIYINSTGQGSGVARYGGSMFVNLIDGVFRSGSGQLVSFGNNAFGGNTSDGTPDATVALK